MTLDLPVDLRLGGVLVGRLNARNTTAGNTQFVIEGVDGKEALTIGGDRAATDVQIGPQSFESPNVGISGTRPDGSTGDVRLRANVTVATDEFGAALPADPAGCINIYRDLHLRPEQQGAHARFFGKIADGTLFEFLRILQLKHGPDALRPALGIRGVDFPDISFDYGADWVKIVFNLPNGRTSKLSVDNDGGLKYEAYTGKVTVLATA